MQKHPNFYKNRVCLNVLANSVENAKACYEATEGNSVLGVLSKKYRTDEAAIEDMKKYQEATNNALSVGLGSGDPNQSAMVVRLVGSLHPQHVNQVFTGVGASRAVMGQKESFINGLVSPTGKVGYVNIATGPLSSFSKEAEVPIETAIAMLKDMGGDSIKYFPMNGLAHMAEFKAVCEACAKHRFSLEPTGGIDLDNFEDILRMALESGVEKVIPHVYSSIIDSKTGDTKPEDVAYLYTIIKKLVDK